MNLQLHYKKMANYITKVGGIATAMIALTITASAEIKLNDNISTSGYIVGSNQYWSRVVSGYSTEIAPASAIKKDSFDVDAAKLLFDLNYKPVSGVVSFYYQPNQRADILDAYATYDAGNGITVSGGKFLTWLGYEAFDATNMYQISYANNDFLGAIPSYHSGVRVEYSDQDYGAGIAVVDSIYSNGNYLKGDGELRYNQGFEAYFTYKGIKDITPWSGIAYESQRTNELHYPNMPAIVTLDFWASYQMDKDTLIAAEFAHKNGDARGDRGYNWLFLTNRTFSEKFSTAFRVSGEHVNSYRVSNTAIVQLPNFTKFTVAPAYNVTANLIVRGEISYYNYANYGYNDYERGLSLNLNHSTYVGVQAIFKF